LEEVCVRAKDGFDTALLDRAISHVTPKGFAADMCLHVYICHLKILESQKHASFQNGLDWILFSVSFFYKENSLILNNYIKVIQLN
jgi:hypothetical protein